MAYIIIHSGMTDIGTWDHTALFILGIGILVIITDSVQAIEIGATDSILDITDLEDQVMVTQEDLIIQIMDSTVLAQVIDQIPEVIVLVL